MSDILKMHDFGESIIEELFKCYSKDQLFPIIGSGFSRGENANKGRVLGGKELVDKFKQLIKVSNTVLYDSIKGIDDFSKIADYALRVTDRTDIIRLMETYFIKVQVSKIKSQFLNLDWKNIFTLNIDDGIENANKKLKVIHPYRNINQDYTSSINCLFKFHGDAETEIAYKNEKNLVFSRNQYLASIKDNIDLINEFQSLYRSAFPIYIGCSLDDEIDIGYAIASLEKDSNKKTYYVCGEKPDIAKQFQLENLGITDVIVIENYNDFYNRIISKFLCKPVKEPLDDFKIDKILCENDSDIMEEYILNGVIPRSDKALIRPEICIERDDVPSVLAKFNDKTSLLIRGRRFSGKSSFLCDLTSQFSYLDIYYFPSSIIVSETQIKAVKKLEYSLIIFDSFSMNYEQGDSIYSLLLSAKDNNNKIVFIVNQSDKIFYQIIHNLNFDIIYNTKETFNDEEIRKYNYIATKNSLLHYYNRPCRDGVQRPGTFIDNIHYLGKIYFSKKADIVSKKISIDSIDLTLFILLASVKKVYFLTIKELGISVEQLNRFIEYYSPLVELHDIQGYEEKFFSGTKLISNSDYWIMDNLSVISKKHQEFTIKILIDIVLKLKPHRHSKYIVTQILLYDKLNEIFDLRTRKDADISYYLYKEVEDVMHEEPDYWLQRAKATHHSSSDIPELREAYNYAKRSYLDFINSNKFMEKAAHTMALISGKIAYLGNYKNHDDTTRAITAYHDAILADRNQSYIEDMIKKARRRDNKNHLYRLAAHLFESKIVYTKESNEVSTILTNIIQ